MVVTSRLGLRIAARTIIIGNVDIIRKKSTIRIRISSINPEKYPATNPIQIPKGTTKEQYDELFMYAYIKGLKGFTTFNPDGSMKGILDSNHIKSDDLRPKVIDRIHAPKRPKDLACDIHKITVGGVKHIILIGKLNGTLYEIFVTNDPENEIDLNSYKEGIIRKVKKNNYNLLVQNGKEKIIIKGIGEAFDDIYGSLSRLLSMSIRHGVPLQVITTQLQKDKNFMGFEKSVSRVLKKYIVEGEEVLSTEECPECGASLIYQEGCVACSNICGWSRCA